MIRLALALALWLLPLSALAGPGAVLELRHGPVGGDCRVGVGPDELAKVGRQAPELGGSRTRRAARILLRQGRPGCDAVRDWLAGDAAGLDGRGLAEAARSLAERGEPADVEAVVALLDHAAAEVTLGVLQGLERRLAVLDVATTTALLADEREGVPPAALALFAGYHSEGRVRFEEGVPVWEETAFWGAPGDPPAHYFEAVASFVDSEDAALRELAAKFLARHGREGHPGAISWGRLLARLIPGRDTAAALAAEGLGWSEAPALYDVESDLLRDPTALRRLLDGLEGRLEAGRGTQESLDRLRRVAASGDKGQPARAGRMLKAWSRRLGVPAP